MGADPRSRHLRRLRLLRRASRRWTCLAVALGGACAVLTPYAGLGAPDALWAGSAGGSAALAVFRWLDYRRVAAKPIPDPPADTADAGLGRLLESHPLGRAVVEEWRRRRDRLAFQGSHAAAAWQRLEAASRAMRSLGPRLLPLASESVTEGQAAEKALRELAHRIAAVEGGLAAAPPDARESLTAARDALVAQLGDGVDAYERLVAAVAECVAEGARSGDNDAVRRLTEATDRVSGFAAGLGEFRE
ncbi:MAG: phage shock envelope stress response protein PspM, partial [Micromonosporaceae bacterium]